MKPQIGSGIGEDIEPGGLHTTWGSGGEESLLESLASEYADMLERGLSVSPEGFAARFPEQGPRLIELLKSIRWIQLAARDLDDRRVASEVQVGDGEEKEVIGPTKRLGDFRLIREVGRGGMGIVYEAEQLSLSRRVAVKILPPTALLDERQVARFAMESQAAAQLQHPHIVPIFAVGCESGIYYYSMQFIDGESPSPRMLPKDVACLGACVADALEHSHALGIIHRDIKPSNLLVDASGEVWVTDFGLARCRQSDQITASGAVLGTLRYMSPEQANGSHSVDPRTDIYSLGVTLYELLTGRCPYDATHRGAFLAELVRGEPERIRRIDPRIPVDLETIIHKAMAADPQSRYPTARAMADDLRRFSRGEVILARRPTVWERASKWVRRNRSLAMAAGVTWGLVSMAALVATGLLLQAEHRNRMALKETQESLREADFFFSQARDVVDHFGVTLSKQLADVPGAEVARREVLHDTLQYYREFMTQAETNPLRQREVALTYMKLGRVAEQMEAGSEAIEAYEQAERIWQSIAPDDSERALCANLRGLMLVKLGERERAGEAFQIATACNRRDRDRNSHSFEAQRRYAVSLTNQSLVRSLAGQADRERASLEEALSIQLELQQREPIEPRQRWELLVDMGKTYGALVEVYRGKDLPRATEYSQRCIECLEAAMAPQANASETKEGQVESRAQRLWREDDVGLELVVAYGNHAALLHDAGAVAQAIRYAEQGTELGVALCQRRDDAEARMQLAASFTLLGRLYGRQERRQEEMHAFQRASQALAGVEQAKGEVVKYRLEMVSVSRNLLRAAEAVSNARIAEEAGEMLARHLRWLCEHAPAAVRLAPESQAITAQEMSRP